MRWYSNYLQILKSASTIAEEEAGGIYRLAFEALKKYGIATLKDGVWSIEDDGLIYSIQDDADVVESNVLNNVENESVIPVGNTREGVPTIDFEAIKENLEEPKEEAPLFEMKAETDDSEEDNHKEDTQETFIQETITERNEENGFSSSEVPTPEKSNPFESNLLETDENNPFALPGGELVDENLDEAHNDNPFYNEGGIEQNQLEIPEESVDEMPDFLGNNPDEPLDELSTQIPSGDTSNDEAIEDNVLEEELPPQQFPLSLQSKDFTFAISGVNSKDLSQQATFLIAPLRTDIETPVSVVKAIINGSEFVYTTDSNGKIEFETEVYTYTIESIMKDGKFSPNVYVKNEDMDDFNHTQKTFGDKGHIALVDEEDEITVHIFPTSFKPNEYHTEDFIYCIDTGDGDFFSDTNHKEKSAFVKINGNTFEITAKWKDGVLYAKIEQAQ